MKCFLLMPFGLLSTYVGAQTTPATSGIPAGAPANSAAVSPTTTLGAKPGGLAATRVSDPNSKKICEYEMELGSRLIGHKICATAGQWQELRAQQRMMIDHVQNQRALNGGG